MSRPLIILSLLLAACGSRPDFGTAHGGADVESEVVREPAPNANNGAGVGAPPGDYNNGGDYSSDDEEPNYPSPDRSAETARFAFDVYNAFEGVSGNVVVAPHSIARSLFVAHAATSGAAHDALANALASYVGASDPYNAFNATEHSFESMQSAAFHLRGAVWLDDRVDFKQSFADHILRYTGLTIRRIDIASAPEDARAEINNWYNSSTGGMISDVLGPHTLDAESTFVVTDATGLNAPWAVPFDPTNTTQQTFAGMTRASSVAMMRGSQTVRYFGDATLHGVELPLAGDLTLIALLPESFDDLASSLNESLLRRLMAESETTAIDLSFPRLDLSYRAALSQVALGLGVESLFDADAMFEPLAEDTPLSDGYHRTRFMITEAGVSASADPEFAPSSPEAPIEVNFNRPFFFAVYSASIEQFVFLGRVTDL